MLFTHSIQLRESDNRIRETVSSFLIEISGSLTFTPQIQAALTKRKAPLLKETSEILKGFSDPSLPLLFLSRAVQYRNEIAKEK